MKLNGFEIVSEAITTEAAPGAFMKTMNKGAKNVAGFIKKRPVASAAIGAGALGAAALAGRASKSNQQ